MKQETFQFYNTAQTIDTAEVVIEKLWPFLSSTGSFIDFGCGVGSWSLAMEKRGISSFLMVDHPTISTDKLVVNQKTCFLPVDLDIDLPPSSRYDLAICTEVLEHFEEARARLLLDFLANQSDLLLFSAAIPGQSGEGHINCQRHEYWHNLLAEKGFRYYDGFKPLLLENQSLHYWIRQNLFLYYKPSQAFRFKGLTNITAPGFEVVHHHVLNRKMGIKEYLKMAPRVFKRKQTWN